MLMKSNSNQIVISLPIDKEWLALAVDYVELYAKKAGFNQRLTDMIKSSTDEAFGALVKSAKTSGKDGEVELGITSDNFAIEISISYDGSIPLNPQKEKPYEVPSGQIDPQNIDTDSLWLFIIKKRMDRVFFQVDGKRQSLCLRKFHRQAGSERKTWIMEQKPELIPKAVVDAADDSSLEYAGFIQNTKSNTVLRLGEIEMHAVQHFDGNTSIYDIYLEAAEKGWGPSPEIYIKLYDALEQNGLLLQGVGSAKNRKDSLQSSLRFSYSLPNSDKIVGGFYRLFRPFYSTVNLVIILLLSLSAIYPLYHSFGDLRAVYTNSVPILKNNWWIAPAVLLLFCLHIFLHEMSHGSVCKKFGGKVSRVGISYYLTTIIFFCDISTSYNFPKKSQRIAVSLAGPVCSLMMWSIACWCFYFIDNMAVKMMLQIFIMAVSFSLIMNFNPLLRMDAYYVVSELLGINNLRSISFQFLKSKLMQLFGFPPSHFNFSKKEQIWIWIYGIVGGFFTLRFMVRPFIRFFKYTSGGLYFSSRLVWLCIILIIVILSVSRNISSVINNYRHRVYKLQ